MKQKDAALLIAAAFFSALFAFLLTSLIFKTPTHRSTKVPTEGSISSSFPDVKNDPTYNVIFNDKALDPSVPLQVGENTNSQPFNGSQ